MRRTGLVLVAVGVLAAAGVGNEADGARVAAPGTAQRSVASALTRVDLVVIGDALMDPNMHACTEGCVSFVNQYAFFLRDTFGVDSYSYAKAPASGVPDAVQLVAEDDEWRQTIADAEVVVVETGFNNALPDPATGIGCAGAFSIDWILSTRAECLEQGVATYGELYAQVFAGINELRAGQPTVLIATTTINGNIDASMHGGLLALAGDRADEVKAWVVAAYDRWNAMLSERAESAGFVVVDLYHAFNGPDGNEPPGELWDGGTSPSMTGYNLIAAMLADVDLTALGC